MDPLGTATEAVSILYEVIKFYRGYRGIPKDIDNSLDRSLRSSQYLKMWMDVFQRLDQNSVPENFSTNLSMTLKRLKLALDAHRREMVEWMVEMGFPEPTIGDESTASKIILIDAVSRPFMCAREQIILVHHRFFKRRGPAWCVFCLVLRFEMRDLTTIHRSPYLTVEGSGAEVPLRANGRGHAEVTRKEN